ncbi:unnamed protein product [Owenia fusiformis]|uniref:Uncharacterized protein n=1 Tax=Owenia fusiformis TaxID=6347 RepID=A0A8J1XTE5_OWEFU|nr:unnamed protein product [Owenia fusiformis]
MIRGVFLLALIGLIQCLPKVDIGEAYSAGTVDGVVQNWMRQNNIPGCSLAIGKAGKVVLNKGYGTADSARSPVTTKSILRIGSISKSVTAIATMKLYEQGKLKLDARVFGPSGILKGITIGRQADRRIADITVRHLLAHTSGWELIGMTDPLNNPQIFWDIARANRVQSPPPSRMVIQHYLNSRDRLKTTPGTAYSYNNFGYLILGEVITKVSGQSYESYVKSLANMARASSMVVGRTRKSERLPNEVKYFPFPGSPKTPSVYKEDGMVFKPYGWYPIPTAAPLGGWVATSADVLAILNAIDGSGPVQLLKPSTVSLMIQKPSHMKGDDAWYGLGLKMEHGGKSYGHDGAIDGTIAHLTHDKTGVNWAIMCNQSPRDQDINSMVRFAVRRVPQWAPAYNKLTLNGLATASSQGGRHLLRAMIPESQIQGVSNQMRGAGYRPTVLSATMRGQSVYFNTIWVKGGGSWSIRTGLSVQGFTQLLRSAQWQRQQPLYFDLYVRNNQPYHAVIMGPSNGPWQALPPVPVQQHQQRLQQLVWRGMKVINQPAYAMNGRIYAAALAVRGSPGQDQAKADLPPPVYAKMVRDGFAPIYLKGYKLPGVPEQQSLRFSAVLQRRPGAAIPQHDLSEFKMSNMAQDMGEAGLIPMAITGFEMGGILKFDTVWSR